ncbi:MAG TPA: hypothetical protein VLH16_03520 [Bacteroidales bacterium]|nr:hypothetical protein [Bacteroidales bacterium]
MKTLKFFLILLIGASFTMSSCDKEDKDEIPLIEKEYFTILNGSFVNRSLPAASGTGAPAIASVSGNATVLAGGSNPITIFTSSAVTDILIGVEELSGYYKITNEVPQSTNAAIMVVVLLSPNVEGNFTIVVALANGNNISQHYTVPVTLFSGGTGRLQVSLSWNKPNDVDLHLLEPTGEEIYYGNSVSANGGELDVDSNAGCSIDNINNENITYSDTAIIANGVYTVKVNLWSQCEVTDPTTYILTVRYNGNIINPLTGSNPYSGVLTPDNEDEPQTPITFRIGSASSASTKIFGFGFSSVESKVISPHKL